MLRALRLAVIAFGAFMVVFAVPHVGEAMGLMGMLGCAILIPGPPGMIGVFQAGICAGMTMYYPSAIISGHGWAYIFVLYVLQVVLQVLFGVCGLVYLGGQRGFRGGLKQLEDAENS